MTVFVFGEMVIGAACTGAPGNGPVMPVGHQALAPDFPVLPGVSSTVYEMRETATDLAQTQAHGGQVLALGVPRLK